MATSSPIPARRGSLVGPLIVLLLGIVLLIGNLRPDLSVWRLFARYWPFLLIFWGFARLLEYAIARLSSRPAPRTLAGGEVFLIILICVAGNAFSSADRGDWGSWRWSSRGLEVFGENYDFTVQQISRQVPLNASLVIENQQGNIRLVGNDTPEVRISGRKTIKAFDRADADQADKDTPVEITEEGGRIHVRTNQDRVHGNRRISSDLEISVPKSANLRLEGRTGDFDVQNVAGPVEVTSGNAGVRLANIEKNVRVNLRRSDVVRAIQVKGNVEISGRGRDIELENVAGTVTIDGDFSGTIKLHNLAKPARYNSSMTDLSFEKLPGHLEMDLGSLHATEIIGPMKTSASSE